MMEEEKQGGPTSIEISKGERVLAGLRTYFSFLPCDDGAPEVSSAVVVACDVSGYEDPKIRVFADSIAVKGYYVVVPDFCRGDPFLPDPPPGGGHPRPFADWLEGHDPLGDAYEDAKLVCMVLKHYHFGIGAVGIGWGAKVVAELAIPRPPWHTHHVSSAVLLDPFSVTLDDFKGGCVPTLVSGAEIYHDHASPQPSQLFKVLSEALATKSEIVSHVKLVPDVANAWVVPAGNEEAVRAKNALTVVFDWFGEHIKGSPRFNRKLGDLTL